jgi:short-subunit dehydrogenase/steroid 5-alpha reductase family enzyme
MSTFREQYGPWAVIAGASVGLGEAFARRLASHGLNLVLLARGQAALETLASDLRAAHGIEARTLAVDLARPDLLPLVQGFTAQLEVGLLVYNAAFSTIGPFLDHPVEEHLRVIDVNCRAPLVLSHHFGRAMTARRRGGVVLMTSTAGSQGGPWIAAYAASKAFNSILAEALWEELAGQGVHVVACRAGATRTPGYAASKPRPSRVPLLDPNRVAEKTLACLGRGPSVVPGAFYRFSAFIMERLLPRRTAIRIMGRATRKLYGPETTSPRAAGEGAAKPRGQGEGVQVPKRPTGGEVAERSEAGEGLSKRAGQAFVAAAYVVALVVALIVGRAAAGLHPIWIAAVADLAATLVVFAFSVALDNSSVYDPYWSVAPLPIGVYWASTGGAGPRQLVILALLAIWGARLTANWALRWRGPADEDFRYVEIRAKTGKAYWPASLASIHVLPTAWVFLGLVPVFPALTRPGFVILDVAATLITGLAIAIETVADRQLRRYLRSPRDKDGILDRGLWAACRHPNYLGEILFWWGLFLFGVAASPKWMWSVVGPLSITLLFVLVSVPWMDRRMLSRHPAWAEHMKKTPALLPRLRW